MSSFASSRFASVARNDFAASSSPFRRRRHVATLLAAIAALPASGQTTLTYLDAQPAYTTPFTTTVANPHTLTIASGTATQSGVIDGDGTLLKTGAGSLTLSGANSFTGTLTIDAGTLGIGHNQALGDSSHLIVINGGTIRAVNAARTVANPLQLNGSFTVGRLTNFSGAATLGANITITGDNPDGPADNNSTFSGVISGVGRSVTIAQGPMGLGTGAIVFSGANTYTGATTVQSGRLVLSNTSASTAYQIDSGGVLEFAVASGDRALPTATFTGTGTLRKTGAGDVRWGAGSATFALGSGALIDVQAGAFVGGSNANEVWTANLSDLHVASGATFNSVEANVRVDALTGSGLIRSGYDPAFGYQNFTFGVDGGSGTFAGVLSDNGGFIGNYVKTGAGAQTLTGTNTYTGTTTLAGGTLALGSAGALGTTGTIHFTGGALQFSAANTTDYSARFATTAGQLYRLDTGGQSVSLASALTSSGGSLTKLGAGTLTLTGTNTYDGGTTLAGGTLTLGSDDALGATGAISFTGGALQFSIANTTDYSARFATTAGQLYRIDTNGESINLASALTSTGGSLVKLGAGTLTLSGLNTFNGGLTLADGTVRATALSSLGAGSLVFAGGDLLVVNDTGLNFARPTTVSADATITLDRATSGAASTHSFGTLSIGTQTVTLARTANLTSGTPAVAFTSTTLTGDATFVLATGTQFNLGTVGQTGGPRSVTFDGPGTGSAGTGSGYTGVTTLKGGVLLGTIFANGGSGSGIGAALADASNLVLDGATLRSTNTSVTNRLFTLGVNGAALEASSPFSFTNAGPIVLSGTDSARTLTLTGGNVGLFAPALGDNGAGATSLLKTGSSGWILSGANTYTGPTTITGGSLALTGAATLASTNVVLSGGGVLALSGASTPALGTGPGQVQFGTGGGGFAAYGAPLVVTTFDSTPIWGTGGVLANGTSLALGSLVATHAVTVPIAIDLGAGVTRDFNITDNGATDDDIAILSGVLSSGLNGGLSKGGAGTLVLTATNTYTGPTAVNGGTLALLGDGAISAANLALGSGGVLATSGIFDRTLGTGPGQVTVNGNAGGGFAAYGGPLTVTGVTGTWGTTAGFLTGGVTGPLMLGSVNATDVVTLTADFSLGATSRTITVNDNAHSTADYAVIGGVISGAANVGFNKSGNGTLVLTGANTYTGATVVSQGVLSVSSLPSVGAGPGPLGAPTTVAQGTIALSGGTLRYTGLGETTDRVINLAGTGSVTLEASGTGPLVFASDLTATSTGAKNLILGGTNTAANTFQGAIVNGSGITGLIKSGPGTWVISGNNTYIGTTTVTEGMLRLGSAGALANSALTVNASTPGGTATLDLNGFSPTVTSLTLGGATGASPTSASHLVATGGGVLTLGGNLTYNATGNPLGSTIAAGLNLGAATRTFTVNDSPTAAIDLAVTGSIGQTATAGLIKAGSGTLFLSGTNTYTGDTTHNGGTLIAGSNSAFGAGTFLFASGIVQGDGTARTLANPISLTTTAPTFGGASDLTFTGLLTNNTNSNPTLNFPNTGATTLGPVALANSTTNRTVTFNTSGGLVTLGGVIANGGGSTASALTKTGPGTLVLAAANTYGGATTVNDGLLRLAAADALPATTVLSLNPSTTSAVLELNGHTTTVASLTLGASNLASGRVIDTAGGGLLRLGGNLTYNNNNSTPVGAEISAALDLGSGVTRTFSVNDSLNAAIDLAISGVIGDTTASGLIKNGNGTLALTGANTYRGPTSLTAGTVVINTLPALGVAGSLGAPSTVADGTIALNGGSLRYTGGGSTTDRVVNLAGTTTGGTLDASGTGPLVFTSAFTATGAGAKTLVLTGTSTAANTLQGAVVNNSVGNTTGLTKTGSGTWLLSGANTYTGTTIVNDGTLGLGASGALTVSGLTVASSLPGGTATFDLNGFSATVPGLGLGGATGSTATSQSRVIATGGGVLSIGASGVNYSATNHNAGGLVSAALDLGALTRVFTVGDSTATTDDLTVSGAIGSTGGGLAKTGLGTLVLSGVNTYTGSTTVNQGLLRLDSATALPATALVIAGNLANSTATLDLNGHDLTVPSLTFGGSATTTSSSHLIATGGGTLTLGGDLVVSATGNPLGATLSAALDLGSTASRTFNILDSASAASDLTISGSIGETTLATTLFKSGGGVLTLTGVNTYTGPTNVNAGALAVAGSGTISAANLNLSGGVFGTNDTLGFSRPLGSGDGQVLLGNGGGFAAHGGDLTLTHFTDPLEWGVTSGFTGTGSALAFGSTGADGVVTWTNGFSLGTGTARTITVIDNPATAADLAVISGVISSGANGPLAKTGFGTLVLTAANTYTGQTTVGAGTLALTGSGTISAANLYLNGGVFATNDTVGFARQLGNGAGQVQLGGSSGGFAAYGGPLTLTSFTGTPTWGVTPGFFVGGGNLFFGSVNATDLVTWTNDFSLGSATRTIQVTDNLFTTADSARISGVISGAANSGLTKTGNGLLELTGANTYTGPTTVSVGTLSIASLPSVGAGPGPLGAPTTVANGTIGLHGGILRYTGAGHTTDRVLNLGLFNTSGTVEASGTGPLVFTSALTATGGGTRNFILSGTNTAANTFQGAIVSGSGTTQLLKTGPGTWHISGANTYTGTTTVTEGLLGLGSSASLPNTALTIAANTPGGTATFDLNGFDATVSSLTLGDAAGSSTASSAHLAATGGGVLTLGGNVVFNSVNHPLGSTVAAGLNLGSGVTRTFTVADSTNAATDLTVSGPIGETTVSGLIKSGAGTLLLSGANTYTGSTTLNQGTLIAGSNAAFGTGTLVLSSGVLRGDGTPRTLANAISLPSSVPSIIGGSSDLTFTGQLTNTFNGSPTLTIANTGTTTLGPLALSNVVTSWTVTINTTGGLVTAAGPISNGLAFAAGLSKSGPGILELGAVNTYAGATTVNDGTLRLGAAGTLSPGTLSILANAPGATAAFDLNGRNITHPGFTLGGTTGTTATSASHVIATGGGTITLTNSITYQATGNPLGSVISADLNFGAAGRSFTVNDSTTAAIDLTVSGDISENTANSGLSKAGLGTLLLSGVNTYTGATTVNAGTLLLGSSTALPATTLSLAANTAGTHAILDLGGHDASTFNLTFGSSTATSASHLAATGGGTLTLLGTAGVTYNNGNNPLGSVLSADLNLGTITRTFAINDSTNAAADLTVSGDISASSPGVGLTKTGLGTLVLSGANTYTGATTINDGTIRLGSATALPSATALTLASNVPNGVVLLDLNGQAATAASLTFGGLNITALTNSAAHVIGTGGGSLALSGPLTYSHIGNPLGSVISADLLLASGGDQLFHVGDSLTAAHDLTISGDIGETVAASGFTKTGAGTLLLSGTNTHSGPTTINDGTVLLGAADSLSAGSALTLANSPRARLDLAGHDQTIGGLSGGGSVGGNVSLGSASLTVRGGGTYLGQLSGTGALVKEGSGTLALPTAQPYSGGTTLRAGTLALGHDASLGSGPLTVTGGNLAPLTASRTLANTLALDGSLGLVSTAANHAFTFTGPVTLGGDSTVSASQDVGSLDIVHTFGGVIDGPHALTLTRQGAATLGATGGFVLSAANTFSGGLTVSDTRLFVSSDDQLGAASGGVTLRQGGILQTSSPLATTRLLTLGTGGGTLEHGANALAFTGLSGSGDLLKSGTGLLTLTGASTYDGILNSTTDLQLAPTATFRFGPTGTTTSGIVNDGTLAFDSTSTRSFDQVVSGSGAIEIEGSATGVFSLGAVNTYAGDTTLRSGTLAFSALSNFGSTGDLVFAGGTLRWSAGNTADPSARFAPLASSDALFDPNGQSVTLATGLTGSAGLTLVGPGTLTLGGTHAYTGPTTVRAGTLALGSATALPAANVLVVASAAPGVTATFDLNGHSASIGALTLGGATSTSASRVLATGGGTLAVTGDITFDATANPLGASIAAGLDLGSGATRTFAVGDSSNAATDLTITGSLGQTTASGLIKTGAGTLALDAANTYTGLTTVQAGTLRLGLANALPSTNSVALADASGARLDLAGHHQTFASLTGGGSTGGEVALGSATLTLASGAFDGLVSGIGGSVIKTSAGTLSLTGANTHSGGTSLTAGTLALGHDSALGSGAFTVTGGSLAPLGASRTLGNSVALNGSLALASTAANHAFTFSGPVALGGNSTLTASQDTGSLDVAHTFAGDISGPRSLTLARQGAATLGTTGGFVLSGNNTFSGGLTVDATRLFIAADTALGAPTSGLTLRQGGILAPSASLDTDRILTVGTGGGTLDHGAHALVFTGLSGSGALLKSGSGSLTLTGSSTYNGTLTSSTALQLDTNAAFRFGPQGTTNADILNDGTLLLDSTTTRTFSPTISGSGSVEIEGSATGVLSLGGLNTYTGGTTLRGGTLVFANPDSFGTGSLTFAGGTLRWAPGNTTDISARISSFNSAGGGFDLNGQSIALATGLTGTGGLALTGGGTLTVTGDNTFDGALTIGSGTTVHLGTGGASGSVTGPIVNNGALVLHRSDDIAYLGALSGNGALTKNGGNTVTLGGDSSGFSGASALNGGTIALAHNNALGTGAATLNGARLEASGGPRTVATPLRFNADTTFGGSEALTLTGNFTLLRNRDLTVENTAVTTLSGVISQSGGTRSLLKFGGGELQLTGANTYTGGTTIAEGTLRINNSTGSAFGSGAVTVESGATLTGAGSFTGALQLNGTFAPGNSPGLASIGSGSVLNGNLLMEIGGLARGTGYDAIDVGAGGNGVIILGGELQVVFFGGYVPSGSASFQLIKAGSFGGSFAPEDITLPTASGFAWDTSRLSTQGYLDLVAVPEPAAYAALAGLLTLGATALRRRKRA